MQFFRNLIHTLFKIKQAVPSVTQPSLIAPTTTRVHRKPRPVFYASGSRPSAKGKFGGPSSWGRKIERKYGL